MIRVLIVAVYAAVRAGLEVLMADAEECRVVGAISGSAELERLLPDVRPDVVLLDDTESDGPVVRQALEGREIGLVLLGDGESGWQDLAGRSLSGWAYLLRDAGSVEISAAVRAVAAGLIVLDPRLTPGLFGGSSGPSGSTPGLSLSGGALTPREQEVLQHMALGLPNRQIADRLFISPHTVKFHVASILAKLGASSRTEAVTLGIRRGDVVL